MHRTGYWRVGIFGKTALGGTRAPRRCSPLYRRSPALSPATNPAPEMARGLVGYFFDLEARSSARAGVEKDSYGHFCFLLRQAADRQVLSKAKPPTVRTSKRLCHQDHATQAQTCPVGSYFYGSIPTLSPLVCLCVGVAAGGIDDIAPRSVVSRVWAAVLVCGPQGCTYVSFLSGHNQPACLG